MNIRNAIIFITSVIFYCMIVGGIVKLGLDRGLSPISFVMFFVYAGLALVTAILYPVFESMAKSSFKPN